MLQLRPRSLAVVSVCAGLAIAACGGDGERTRSEGRFGSGESFSILAGLAEVPVRVTDLSSDVDQSDLVEVLVGDLAAASAAAGRSRPEKSADDREVVEWARSITEGAVFVPIPRELATGGGIALAQDYRDEVGFALNDVDSYVWWYALPESGAVWAGGLSVAATSEVADGVVSLGEGEDFAFDPSQRSVARSIGAPLRFAERDGLVLSTKSTRVALDWLDGASDRLAGDPVFAAAASALDERDVIGAVMVRADHSEPDDRSDALIQQPFDLISIGWALESGEPLITVVYSFATPESASTASSDIDAVFSTAPLSNGQPISEIVTLDAVTVDGSQVIATLKMADGGRGPEFLYQMLLRPESPFMHT
jgi:hypothetical protein